MVSWMVNLKNQTVWIKNFAYWKVFGKRLNVIRSSNLEKHGNTDISVKCPYSERSPPLKTGVGLKYPREKISHPRNTHEKKLWTYEGTVVPDPRDSRWHETHGIKHTPTQIYLNELSFILAFRSSRKRCSIKKGVLEISQNWQENTCVRVSFLNKVAGLKHATLL